MTRELPVWRSLMYCPVNVEKYVDRAHTRGADVIQLDLEDSVPMAEKAGARKLVEKAAARVRRGGADVVVRFNQPLSMAVRDIEHAICPDVDALACTKIGGVSHVQLLDELVSEKYLRALPVDPFTNSADTWQVVLSEPEPGNAAANPGVYDIKSGAEQTAIDGTRYAEWE